MNSISNFGKHFAISTAFVLAINFAAQAQSPVESTHIDEKYAYTTVVYKNKAANDKDVLSSLENDFGIGDVVRVTLAPPPPPPTPLSAIAASEPVYADKNKGEDTWLPAARKPTSAVLTASTTPTTPTSKTAAKSIAVSPKPVPIETKALTPMPVVVAKTATPEVPKPTKTVAPAPVVPKVESEAAPVAQKTSVKTKSSTSGKSVKAHKSVKKSGKKSNHKTKFKHRKRGKQRYACPKF